MFDGVERGARVGQNHVQFSKALHEFWVEAMEAFTDVTFGIVKGII